MKRSIDGGSQGDPDFTREAKKVERASDVEYFEEAFAGLTPENLNTETVMRAIKGGTVRLSQEMERSFLLNYDAEARLRKSLNRLFADVASDGRVPKITVTGASFHIEFTRDNEARPGEKVIDRWANLSLDPVEIDSHFEKEGEKNRRHGAVLRIRGVGLGTNLEMDIIHANAPSTETLGKRTKGFGKTDPDYREEAATTLASDVNTMVNALDRGRTISGLSEEFEIDDDGEIVDTED